MKCMWSYSQNPIHATTNNCMSDDCITVSQTAANTNGLLPQVVVKFEMQVL